MNRAIQLKRFCPISQQWHLASMALAQIAQLQHIQNDIIKFSFSEFWSQISKTLQTENPSQKSSRFMLLINKSISILNTTYNLSRLLNSCASDLTITKWTKRTGKLLYFPKLPHGNFRRKAYISVTIEAIFNAKAQIRSFVSRVKCMEQ